MRPASQRLAALAVLAAAGLMAAPVQAQSVEGLEVAARRTTVQVELVGKSDAAVRQEIAAASRGVCRNAVRLTEIDTADFVGCVRFAQRAALQDLTLARSATTQTALLVRATAR